MNKNALSLKKSVPTWQQVETDLHETGRVDRTMAKYSTRMYGYLLAVKTVVDFNDFREVLDDVRKFINSKAPEVIKPNHIKRLHVMADSMEHNIDGIETLFIGGGCKKLALDKTTKLASVEVALVGLKPV